MVQKQSLAIPIRMNGRDLKPHKAIVNTKFGVRTVLASNPWDFVALWLKREKKNKASFYWQQARVFSDAARGMPIASAPLLHYYTFMNAAKALLSSRGVVFDEHHGVQAHDLRKQSKRLALSNEGVKIQKYGIAHALSQYLGELETKQVHSLEDLLFNIPCIHRTFCLTYKNQSDLFIPLTDCKYVYDKKAKQAYFSARFSRDFKSKTNLRRLPPSFIEDKSIESDQLAVRSVMSVPLTRSSIANLVNENSLRTLQKSIRDDLNYISGSQTLWYLKSVVSGHSRLNRQPLTLMLLAMHRLSEICRYRPMELDSFLSGQKNWLLTEFIQMVPSQFIDEISSEITGYQVMIPNVRLAT